MDTRFLSHNMHLESPKQFLEFDPQLRRLKKQYYRHKPSLLDELPTDIPGIYTISGGRQVGKTTLLKQWMEKLLSEKVIPNAIAFFTGELIDDHHTLLHLLQAQLASMPKDSLRYILLDEVTYIRDWDKAIKYAADSDLLENVILILTGSDLVFIQEARMRFPGRRGQASTVNFHLYPLSFREFILLKHHRTNLSLDNLFSEFNQYLIHGGYLTAINDLAMQGAILESTLVTYSDWIRGDVIKRGKQEHYLREILNAIIKHYGSQITWNVLAQSLSIDHPKTIADYTALLESMDAVFVQAALLEDKLTAAPKKARKVMFTDPFIFHAIRAWLYPTKNPYEHQIQSFIQDPIACSKLVECCVATHYRRYYPTYYLKGTEGEVDIAYIHAKRFWPIEIKWTQQLNVKDLKQIAKYKNARIFSKTQQSGLLNNIIVEPLPLSLLGLGA